MRPVFILKVTFYTLTVVLKMLDDNRGATFSFCSDVRWQGALVFLWNPSTDLESGSTCRCTVNVPGYTHVETSTSFYLPPITNYTGVFK